MRPVPASAPAPDGEVGSHAANLAGTSGSGNIASRILLPTFAPEAQACNVPDGRSPHEAAASRKGRATPVVSEVVSAYARNRVMKMK